MDVPDQESGPGSVRQREASMNISKLLFDEIRYRKINFFLMLFGVAVAVSLFVASGAVVNGYHSESIEQFKEMRQETEESLAQVEDETRKIMLKLGFNLKILHRDTNMDNFWSEGYSEHDIPQEYVDRLANSKQLTLVTHLVATLQRKITWNHRKALLMGYLPETPKVHEKAKKPMGFDIAPGTVYVGHNMGIDHEVGDSLDILGKSFTIAKILPERGTVEDITLAMHLGDAQQLLDEPGKVNQIMAIGCRCKAALLPEVRKQLEAVLPETKIYEVGPKALARVEERALVAKNKEEVLANWSAGRNRLQQRMESFAAIVTPLVVLAAAVWVGLLTWSNVRERHIEIGLLRALGKGSARIAMLFLGKALLLGVVGGALGFGVGALLARVILIDAMGVAPSNFQIPYTMLSWSILGAPVVCALASYLPALKAVLQDPAIVLRDA